MTVVVVVVVVIEMVVVMAMVVVVMVVMVVMVAKAVVMAMVAINVQLRKQKLGGNDNVLFIGTTWEAKTERSLFAFAEAIGIADCTDSHLIRKAELF